MKQTFVLAARDSGIFIGDIPNYEPHSHYPIQISIGLEEPLTIIRDKKIEKYRYCIIKPNVSHQLQTEGPLLSLFVVPLSKLGVYLIKHQLPQDISHFDNKWTQALGKLAGDMYQKKIPTEEFVEQYRHLLDDLIKQEPFASSVLDCRICEALHYMEEYSENIIPLEKMARYVCLSPSRFLKLFKEQTGMTYRRMQLWLKIKKTIHLYSKTQNLTTLSHQAGFSDSAHLSRIFKETFGISPIHILKNSKFIQVYPSLIC